MLYRTCQPCLLSATAALMLLGPGMAAAALIDPDNPTNPVIDTIAPVINPLPADQAFSISNPARSLDMATEILPAGLTVEDKAEVTDVVVPLTISPTGTVGPFLPGRHAISWTATDSANNTVTEIQNVDIRPKVNFAIDQTGGEGNNNITVTAHLSGPAPIYPVTIPFTVAGTSDATDHNAVAGNIVITAGNLSGSYSFSLTDDSPTADSGEIVIFTFGALEADRVDLGTKNTHTVTISETNLSPTIEIIASQNGNTTRIITTDDGEVTLAAAAYDPNGDSISYDWSATDNSLVPTSGTTGDTFTFDPSGLSDGYYTIRLTISDGTNTTSTDLLLKILNAAPTLSTTTDSDGDHIADFSEGISDDDNDGIPNFQDTINNPAWLQGWYPAIFNADHVISGSKTVGAITLDWSISNTGSNLIYYPMLLATEPGLRLGLGKVAFFMGEANARVKASTAESILGADISDTIIGADGQVVDIEISGLKNAAATIKFIIPQSAPIPPSISGDPEFYIYSSSKTWGKFSRDASNTITTADRVGDYCPKPGDAAYTTVLTGAKVATDKECVQIQLEDGGPNDRDGLANGVIRFMGGIFVATSSSSPSTPSDPDQVFSGAIDTSTESLNKNDAGGGSGGGGLGIYTLSGLLLLGLRRKNGRQTNKP